MLGFSGDSEGEALNDWGEGMDLEWDEVKTYEDESFANLSKLFDKTNAAAHARYDAASKAHVGDTISCAFCSKRIVKTTHHKHFCSDRCKDRYWNTTDARRRNRARNLAK